MEFGSSAQYGLRSNGFWVNSISLKTTRIDGFTVLIDQFDFQRNNSKISIRMIKSNFRFSFPFDFLLLEWTLSGFLKNLTFEIQTSVPKVDSSRPTFSKF